MKTSLNPGSVGLALLAGLSLSTIVLRAEVEDKINKTFNAAPGGQLVLTADRGSIEVKTADVESVAIEVTRKAGGSTSAAEERLKKHVVDFSQEGNQVTVTAKYDGGRTSGWFGNWRDLQVHFDVTVPRKFNVDLKTAGGSIKVAALTGKVQAHTSGGSLTFGEITGPLTGRTSGGSINVAGCKGRVDVQTSGGSISLGSVDGDVTAHTSGGSINAKNLAGKAVVETSGGSIHVAEIKGQIEANTSGGSVSATLLDSPAGACSFKTSGGTVTVTLGEKLAVDVDARTTGGRVVTDLPVVSVIQGEQKKNELRGKINGGGPLITAHTSGGNVHLKKP
jgi:DUF4097 and DUF4098 domain-containing protein YvlB